MNKISTEVHSECVGLEGRPGGVYSRVTHFSENAQLYNCAAPPRASSTGELCHVGSRIIHNVAVYRCVVVVSLCTSVTLALCAADVVCFLSNVINDVIDVKC